jgi:hypothetical protein
MLPVFIRRGWIKRFSTQPTLLYNYTKILLELPFIFSIFPVCRLKQGLCSESFLPFVAVIRLTAPFDLVRQAHHRPLRASLKLTTYQPFCPFTTPRCKPATARCKSPKPQLPITKQNTFFTNYSRSSDLLEIYFLCHE